MARVVVPGYPHHVTQRDKRRQRTFFDDADFDHNNGLMAEFSRMARTEVWAYCLMPNHVHLVMVPEEADGLRAVLSEVHRRYTRRINFRHGWHGHLWQERFHSFVMDERHLLATVRYVENNPVVARMSAKAEQWRWSSATAHLKGRRGSASRRN
jgi:putative transposase